MKNILLWLWQFPQNIIGFIFSLFGSKKFKMVNSKLNVNETIVYFNNFPNLGAVSLGNYIVIFKDRLNYRTLLHELGHTRQSILWGPLYLLTVGLVSVIRNIWDRLAHKKLSRKQRLEWYYGGYPEKQANEYSEKYLFGSTVENFMFSIGDIK